jgi:phosphatidylinositol 4-kinase B
VPDALSLDALKKTTGFDSLTSYFNTTYCTAARLAKAKYCFISSLAAYSLASYILQIKDRHNGNILIDSDGHIVHIDFGFVLSQAPGGSFSLESAPFKLTNEMVEVMGGPL